MLKSTHTLRLLSAFDSCNLYRPVVTQVRWRWIRKPMWMPTAKSKVFRVSPRLKAPPDEDAEMKRLFNNYRTQMKSLRNYLDLKYNVKYLDSYDPEQTKKIFEEDFQRCMDINNKWNEEQRVAREKQTAENLEHNLQNAKDTIIKYETERTRRLEEVERIVLQEKENAKTYIKQKDLDAVLEYAYNNPVDYNYAINVDGTLIYGRETSPADVKKIDNVKQ